MKLEGLTPQMVLAVIAAREVYGDNELVITSGSDGKHSIRSLHYSGNALDLRTRHLEDASVIAASLAAALGDNYDVVLEGDHIHVEYDP